MNLCKNTHTSVLVAFVTFVILLFGYQQESLANSKSNTKSVSEKHDKEGHGQGEEKHGDEEEGHDEEEQVVRLSAADIEEFDIEIQIASSDNMDHFIELPGEIVLNADRLTHVPPRLPGIVREVFKSLGDEVKAGDILAVIESRELADAKSEYLAARERTALAAGAFEREEKLWRKKISAEREYFEARNALAEARITQNSTEQKLLALGFSDAYLKKLPELSNASFTLHQISAPFSGTIIEKHITLGEVLDSGTKVFTIADLSTVWVDINIYQKDLERIEKGQSVVIKVGHGNSQIAGQIVWVSPLVSEVTRTAKARVVLSNSNAELRPGQFITAKVAVSSTAVGVRILKTALQTVEGRSVVFVQTQEGFEPHPVEIGQKNKEYVEIVSGLRAGQSYVSQGAFTLKAQLSKGAFGSGHGH